MLRASYALKGSFLFFLPVNFNVLGLFSCWSSEERLSPFCQEIGLGLETKTANDVTSEVQAGGTENISATGYLTNLDSSFFQTPTTSLSSINLGPKTPTNTPPATLPPPSDPHSLATLPDMANFPLDPMQYLPAGHHIIDVGDARWPRTFVTPHIPIVPRHEDFMLAEAMPVPPLD